MFSNPPSSVSPIACNRSKRRSKSLDDMITEEQQRLAYYHDTTSVITHGRQFESVRIPRRHSLLDKQRNAEYVRLAAIYGWTATHKNGKISNELHDTDTHLHTSRSLSPITLSGSKLVKMLGRKTNGPSLFPNIKNDIHRSTSKGIVSAIISASENNTSLGWVGVDDGSDTESKSIPPRPIENDPQVFDILAKDSLHFIHYGKCDTTMTSATTEKLVEKLTREMDSQFLMDFFLTFRQFLTPIKLCKLLILRFRWALLDNTDERRLVRIRTFVVIRHWLTHYWAYDFMDSRTLRFMLCTFLSQLRTHSVILASPRDELIIKNLRNVLKRQRKFYKNGNTELPWSSKKPSFSSCSNERKDSAIGLQVASSNTSTHDCTKKDTHAWTDKMKRSIQKTVATIKVHHSGCTQHQEKVCLLNPPQHSSFNQIKTIFLNTHWLPSLKSAGAMKPIVMQYRSEIIAQQFCIIEQSMLMDVTWDELIELRWKKRSFSKRRPDINPLDQTEEIEEHTDFRLDQSAGIDTLIGFFNLTCQWIASEIVKMQSIDSRVKLIEKFIRIASKCYHHRNYSSLMQILLGLQSPAVSRLEKTWERVGPSEIQFFKQLKEMAKPFKNWKNVRDCMSKAIEDIAESSAVESILTHSNFEAVENAQGCIPFLGLYLSDLVFLAELPTFIESDMDDSSKEEDEGDKELNERLSNHLVNYNKFRITASVIKHVLAFQVLSKAYHFKIHPILSLELRTMTVLNNEQMRQASLLCEK